MFHFLSDLYRHVPEAILSGRMFAITNKLKFVVCPSYVYSLSGPETLLVTYDYWDLSTTNVKVFPDILKKRWQTLDLKSVMSELERSSSRFMVTKDTLSSVHRFKRKEGASLS